MRMLILEYRYKKVETDIMIIAKIAVRSHWMRSKNKMSKLPIIFILFLFQILES